MSTVILPYEARTFPGGIINQGECHVQISNDNVEGNMCQKTEEIYSKFPPLQSRGSQMNRNGGCFLVVNIGHLGGYIPAGES